MRRTNCGKSFAFVLHLHVCTHFCSIINFFIIITQSYFPLFISIVCHFTLCSISYASCWYPSTWKHLLLVFVCMCGYLFVGVSLYGTWKKLANGKSIHIYEFMLWAHVRNIWQTNTYTYECVRRILVMLTFCTFEAVKYFTHNTVTIAQYVCFSGKITERKKRKSLAEFVSSLHFFVFRTFLLDFLAQGNGYLRPFSFSHIQAKERNKTMLQWWFNLRSLTLWNIKWRALKSVLRF